MEKDSVLEMRHIYKTFPGVKALQDVDFTLKKGEIHALMGENGAGKSTLIKVLTGVEEFETGEIMMEDTDHPIINRSPQEAQKHGISTVYQEINLCPNLTVAENLFIGREPRKAGLIDWKTMNQRAGELLADLEIFADVTKTIDNYSIAVQQMIAIARAVDMSAKVLILDEPTRGIDVGTKTEIQKLVIRLAEEGMAVVFISSEIEEILRTCERMVVMRDGSKVGELSGEEMNQSTIMSTIAGGQ
ncbi:MAG: ATP-binding cassette domain-containing protein [Schaedlerella sp.]